MCEFCDGNYCKNRPIPPEEYRIALEFLSHIGRNKHINRSASTYSLKHTAEKWKRSTNPDDGSYVCGCTLARAAKDSGYTLARASYASPNWFINFSSRELRKLV
jgi:hypothetical protein